MRKTANIDAFRGIQKRFVSFLSILLVVMLGSAGFFITCYLKSGMEVTGTEFYDRLSYKDFQMVSSLGITDEDIEEIKSVDGVADAEGTIFVTGSMSYNNVPQNADIFSATKSVNLADVLEGRLPSAADECSIPYDYAELNNISLGETITLIATFNNQNVLLNDEFTIVGFHRHPDYMRVNSTYGVVLDKKAFDNEVLNDVYTRVYVKESLEKDSSLFSDNYFDHQEKLKERLNTLAKNLEISSVERAVRLGNEKIDEEWAKVKKELDNAQKEIDDGKQLMQDELTKASYQISSGQRTLASSYNQLIDGQIKIEAGESELNANMTAFSLIQNAIKAAGINLDDVRSKAKYYADGFREIYNLLNALDRDDTHSIPEDVIISICDKADALLNDVQNSSVYAMAKVIAQVYGGVDIDVLLNNTRSVIQSARAAAHDFTLEMLDSFMNSMSNISSFFGGIVSRVDTIKTAENEIKKGRAQLDAAKKELANGWSQYNSGKSQLAYAQTEMATKKAEAEAQINDAQALLDSKKQEAQEAVELAREELNNIKCTWIVTDRNTELSYLDLKNGILAFANAGKVFGLLFAFVGGLVCFSTLVIIIEEEKKHVGTAKAFGLRNNEIVGKYLLFGTLSAFIGAVLGAIIAYFSTRIINIAIENVGLFNFGRAATVMDYPITIGVIIGVTILSALVAFLSCSNLLKLSASALMKGQTINKPKKKNQKTSEKGTLYSRLIFRNIINDKARVIISIIIVAGSVLIIGSGISIRDGFDKMQTKQISDIEVYDVRIDYKSNISEEELTLIQRLLDKKNVFYTNASFNLNLYRRNDALDGVNLLIADKDEIGNYFKLYDSNKNKKMSLPEDGFIAQKKIAENKKLEVGETWIIYDDNLNKHYAEYEGSFNNYIGRLIIMSYEAYEKSFGQAAVNNCFYVNLDGANLEELKAELLNINDDLSFYNPKDNVARLKPMTSLYDIIVYVMIGISVLMSFMILTNLASIFINRKKKELIVMRINGFSIAKTKEYLAKETIATTVIGLLLGSLLGMLYFSKMIIMTMEGAEIQFVRTLNPRAWIIAVILEAAFAVIIYIISFKKIERLNFREI